MFDNDDTGNVGPALGGNLGVTPLDFATYGVNGVMALPLSSYKGSIAAAGPNDVVRLVVGETLTANKVIGGLLIDGNFTVAQANFTLGITSGGVLGTNGATPTISGGTLDFGANEGIVVGNSNTTISSSITGTNGMTYANAGTVTLSAQNSYGGVTTLDQGTLTINNIVPP